MAKEEKTPAEDRLEQALEKALTAIVARMNESAVRVPVPTSQDKSNNSLLDKILALLRGKMCTVIMKNGKRYDNFRLVAFDQTTLLFEARFDVGAFDPLFRQLAIAKSEVSIITEVIDDRDIAEAVRRHKMQYDATA